MSETKIDLSRGQCQKEFEEYLDQEMWKHVEEISNINKQKSNLKNNLIDTLVNKALQQSDIREMVALAIVEGISGTDIYEIDGWYQLTPESEELIFGRKVPDSLGYEPDDDDNYDDTREGEYIYLYPEATDLLVQKVKKLLCYAICNGKI